MNIWVFFFYINTVIPQLKKIFERQKCFLLHPVVLRIHAYLSHQSTRSVGKQ